MSATNTLHHAGQSLWLDNITRSLLDSGTLKTYIKELSVTGLTSNPTIFDHAIRNSLAYDTAIAPLEPKDVVRGQFRGYRAEKGVARDSQTETFAALRFEINSWRWKGVPLFIRAGKNLPVTCTELMVRFKRPREVFAADGIQPNHFRFRISPEVEIAHCTMVKSPEAEMSGEPIELMAMEGHHPNEMDAYERVLRDAMLGDTRLFAREDYVEEAWRIVDPLLKAATPVYEYDLQTWGPAEVKTRIVPVDGWNDPAIKRAIPEVQAA